MYTGDVRKHLASYRIPEELLATLAAVAAERGETATDGVIWGIGAYIQRGEAAGIVSSAPVSVASVHTHPEAPVEYAEAPRADCRHPADRVDTDTSTCLDCGADVW